MGHGGHVCARQLLEGLILDALGHLVAVVSVVEEEVAVVTLAAAGVSLKA
jgi:hypothetical protein